MTGRVVLLSGASAVGKMTIARTLLDVLPVPAVYWPREAVRVGAGGADLPELEQRLFTAYVGALRAYASWEFVVIGEAIIMARAELEAARTALAGTSPLLVRLVAPLETLVEREDARATTYPGTAADTSAREFRPGPYDLTFDTVVHGPADVATEIERALEVW